MRKQGGSAAVLHGAQIVTVGRRSTCGPQKWPTKTVSLQATAIKLTIASNFLIHCVPFTRTPIGQIVKMPYCFVTIPLLLTAKIHHFWLLFLVLSRDVSQTKKKTIVCLDDTLPRETVGKVILPGFLSLLCQKKIPHAALDAYIET